MPLYSLFLMRDGQLVNAVARNFDNDLEALADAYKHCTEHSVEVWHADRLVARVHSDEHTVAASNSVSN